VLMIYIQLEFLQSSNQPYCHQRS